MVVSAFGPLSGLPSTPMYSILLRTSFDPFNISGSKPSASSLKNFILLILFFKTNSFNVVVSISIFSVNPLQVPI